VDHHQPVEEDMPELKGFSPPMAPFIYPALQQSIDTLRTLIRGPDKLHLVVGDTGSGKTTLLTAFLSSASDAWSRCRIRIRVHPSQHTPGGVATCHAIQIEHQPLPIFALEDAHRLPVHALSRLLQQGRQSWNALEAKALILVGQRELVRILEQLAEKMLPDTALNTLYVPPLKADQIGAYIDHRFKHHPLLPRLSLKRRHIDMIHQATGGNPALVNQFVIELLAASERRQERRANNGMAQQMRRWLGLKPKQPPRGDDATL
jgi:type II secretory pathway predicted ATPase ExeA